MTAIAVLAVEIIVFAIIGILAVDDTTPVFALKVTYGVTTVMATLLLLAIILGILEKERTKIKLSLNNFLSQTVA